mmetsp:Transcript_129287/g.360079  ORF Transcript_129287/g.360079 Transcript_129287/m.360079 type:complete len:105 (+) Transcript_129287:66-380(+)
MGYCWGDRVGLGWRWCVAAVLAVILLVHLPEGGTATGSAAIGEAPCATRNVSLADEVALHSGSVTVLARSTEPEVDAKVPAWSWSAAMRDGWKATAESHMLSVM